MATTAIVARNKKREKLIKLHAEKRAELKKTMKSTNSSPEEIYEAFLKLQKLPRNSSRVRHRNRCLLTGRANAVLTKFGLCRNEFRRLAHMGQVIGVRKASW